MKFFFIGLLMSLGLTLAARAVHSADNSKTNASEGQKFKYELLKQLGNNTVIWGFDFLSGNKIIFTERSGALKILDLTDKKVTEIKDAPKVWANGQGGLLDVRVHTTKKDQIYLTYAEPVGEDKGTTAFASAKLKDNELTNFKKIFSALEPNDEKIHFGS